MGLVFGDRFVKTEDDAGESRPIIMLLMEFFQEANFIRFWQARQQPAEPFNDLYRHLSLNRRHPLAIGLGNLDEHRIVHEAVAPAMSAAWELDMGMALQVLFALLLFTVVHVVATVPATGAVDQVAGVVTSQPMYSFTDVAVSSMAFCLYSVALRPVSIPRSRG